MSRPPSQTSTGWPSASWLAQSSAASSVGHLMTATPHSDRHQRYTTDNWPSGISPTAEHYITSGGPTQCQMESGPGCDIREARNPGPTGLSLLPMKRTA